MHDEQNLHEPEQTVATEAAEAEASTTAQARGQRSIAVLATGVLVALLPVAYVLFHHSGSASTAQAAAVPQPSPAAKAAAAQAAIPGLEQAAAAEPTSENRISLALTYIDAGEIGRAPAILQQVIATDPKNIQAWTDLCTTHIMLRQLKEGVDECTHATQLDPSFQLAQNDLKWGQSEFADESAELSKMDATPVTGRDGKYYLEQGNHYLHLGRYDEAVSAWQRVLLSDSRNAVAANNIGTALMMKHQPLAAAGWFEKAASWDSSLTIAQNNLAWAKSEMNK